MINPFQKIKEIQNPKKVKKVTWKDILYNYNLIPIISAIIFITWALAILNFSNTQITSNEIMSIFIDGIISFVLITTNLILLSLAVILFIVKHLLGSKIELKEALYLSSIIHSIYSFIPLVLVILLPIFSFILLSMLVFFELTGIIILGLLIILITIAYIVTTYFTLIKLYPKEKNLVLISLILHFFVTLIIISILLGFFSLIGIITTFSGLT